MTSLSKSPLTRRFAPPSPARGEGASEPEDRYAIASRAVCPLPLRERADAVRRPGEGAFGGSIGLGTSTTEYASHRGAKRGALRRGPCITGGVSPSLHLAPQSVTGPIFTGRPQPSCRYFRYESRELKYRQEGGAASSGSPQSQDPTKASRRAPLAFSKLDLPTRQDSPLSHREPLRRTTRVRLWERVGVRGSGLSIEQHPSPGASRHPLPLGEGKKCRAAIPESHRVSLNLATSAASEFASHRGAKRGALRRGPCIMGGVSPSLHLAPQSVTGPIFTGLPQPLPAVSQYGFLEPETAGRGEVASSGSPQSQDPTKACRLAPLAFIPSVHCSLFSQSFFAKPGRPSPPARGRALRTLPSIGQEAR
jgi:hypothetical protein